MDGQKPLGKSFEISKQEVWDAWLKVKANKGAPGVDGQSVEDFEADLKGNLYKIWNRMSSGSYFPPPVKAVEIPKAHSVGTRILGVPTVADRIAQTVAAARLEKNVEPKFHDDSYGYRPGRSALHAAGKCRERCWRHDWVIDLDIRKFFDSVPCDLIVKAVEVNTSDAWVILYVKRWLAAPLQMPDGSLAQRDRGTPQGSAVSPVLANLFLHYAVDMWMAGKFPSVPFERYVDGAVGHPGRQGVDELLRGVLQDRAVPSPPAHQGLPDALAGEEIQAAPDLQESACGVAADNPPVSAVLRAMAVGPRVLAVRRRRARRRETVTPGSAGARGCDSPGPPDQHTSPATIGDRQVRVHRRGVCGLPGIR